VKMESVFIRALTVVLAVLLAAPIGAFAQGKQASHTFSQQELDQMLAPIALYPDSLLAQILVASTFPDQVVEADRWLKDHKGLSGDRLNNKLDKMDWDLSVKALVPFPQVLAMMDEQLDWTRKLGEAFLAQQKQVMASIQNMRSKAYANGNLKSTDQQKVTVQGEDIEIQPANPETVYVPYYDPSVAYGSWWWPGYAPFAFYPFGYSPLFSYGALGFFAGIGVGAFWNSGWGGWNWGGGDVNINVNRRANINRNNPRFARNNMRTTSFRQAAQRGTIGSRDSRIAAGRTAAGGRASTAAVERGLSGAGRTGAGRGGSRAGVSRGGTARGGVARGGGARGSGVVRGGAAARDRDIARGGGARGTGSVSRGGGVRSGGAHFSGGGAHFGGGGGHFGGGGGHGGGGGGHGGGGRR